MVYPFYWYYIISVQKIISYKILKNTLSLFIILLLTNCSTSIKTKVNNSSFQSLNDDEIIYILKNTKSIPENSIFIGNIKIGDTGFSTDCSYKTVINDAKKEAKKLGANLVLLTEVKEPTTFGSTCYKIRAELYRNLDESSIFTLKKNYLDKNKTRLPENADYALIHFYRPKNALGMLLGYKIRTSNDSIIGKLNNGEKFIYKTKTFGNQKFYGELEAKKEIEINVKKGEEYFVSCGVVKGVVFGRPEMNIVQNHLGIKQFEETN